MGEVSWERFFLLSPLRGASVGEVTATHCGWWLWDGSSIQQFGQLPTDVDRAIELEVDL